VVWWVHLAPFDQDWFPNKLFISGLLVRRARSSAQDPISRYLLDLRSVGPLKINLKLGECTRYRSHNVT
jgi:hypothetical protein